MPSGRVVILVIDGFDIERIPGMQIKDTFTFMEEMPYRKVQDLHFPVDWKEFLKPLFSAIPQGKLFGYEKYSDLEVYDICHKEFTEHCIEIMTGVRLGFDTLFVGLISGLKLITEKNAGYKERVDTIYAYTQKMLDYILAKIGEEGTCFYVSEKALLSNKPFNEAETASKILNQYARKGA